MLRSRVLVGVCLAYLKTDCLNVLREGMLAVLKQKGEVME